MKDAYIFLTGGKNNAGDFLIKHRAMQLLESLRPDRSIIDRNAWEPFDAAVLEEVNTSRALILTGGPALQKRMRPDIYPMTRTLDDIRVPIIMMGIGWKSMQGGWEQTASYPLNSTTMQLLRRIDSSGFASGLRDYHTLNTLYGKGMKNILMTGCPALYSFEHIGKELNFSARIGTVAFSMGVAFVHSRPMEKLMKDMISRLRDYFSGCRFIVAFHHSVDPVTYLESPGAKSVFARRHGEFIRWLDDHGIEYRDISTSAERMIELYDEADLHVGFRVHAHLYMNSISKPSVLLNEDGRGKAVGLVLGGLTLDAYLRYRENYFIKGMNRLGLSINPYVPYASAASDLVSCLDYEIGHSYPRMRQCRLHIDALFPVMKHFIMQLP